LNLIETPMARLTHFFRMMRPEKILHWSFFYGCSRDPVRLEDGRRRELLILPAPCAAGTCCAYLIERRANRQRLLIGGSNLTTGSLDTCCSWTIWDHNWRQWQLL